MYTTKYDLPLLYQVNHLASKTRSSFYLALIFIFLRNQAHSQKCIPGGARPHKIVRLKCNEYKLVY